jgi:hypothetical protein
LIGGSARNVGRQGAGEDKTVAIPASPYLSIARAATYARLQVKLRALTVSSK